MYARQRKRVGLKLFAYESEIILNMREQVRKSNHNKSNMLKLNQVKI
jgi:hypothetical protein